MTLDSGTASESEQDDGQSSEDESAAEKREEKIIEQAKRRFKLCEEAESDNRRLARDDYAFRSGKQWDDKDISDRRTDGRPCLTHNRMPQFIHQVTNDQRQNRPSIKVHPIDDKGDVETAKVIQGLVRHIESKSNADTAYDTATDGAATGGFGFFRIITEYANHKSFDLELRIKRMRNPFAAYLDPSHQEPDGSDANYGFTWDDYQEDEYKARFPGSELADTSDWSTLGAAAPGWLDSKSARVLEYFDRVMVPDTLCELSDGSCVLKSEYVPPEPQGELINAEPAPAAPTIVAERPTKVPKVSWYKINGIEILEETEWVSKWIPIIPVYGDEYIDPTTGKVIREGIVRNAKDSQRMLNFYYSMEAETIALAPRTPFIGAEGQFEGHEAKWMTANKRNHAFLEYKVKDLNGQPLPPPQRQAFEPPVAAITQAKAMAADDMKATTGIYDAALGQRSNENSGIAIQRRNAQTQTSNFHIVDNLSKSIRHAGRILVDGIPKVYDGARAARIIGEEGDQRIVRLNERFKEKGKDVLYDMSVGEYDVAVDTGPSFATKRQEGSAAMIELSKSIPAIGTGAPDLILKSMDVPGAQEMAERIKKMLPPGLAEDDQEQSPLPPQVKAQMQQMGQMIEQLTHATHEQAHIIETKRMELESRERIENAKIQANLEIEMAKLGHDGSVELLAHQIREIEQRQTQFLKFNQPIEAESESGPEAAGAPGAGQPMDQPPIGGESPSMPGEQPGQSLE